eukprot:1178322-Prorocentrum_minimum.AAC.4
MAVEEDPLTGSVIQMIGTSVGWLAAARVPCSCCRASCCPPTSEQKGTHCPCCQLEQLFAPDQSASRGLADISSRGHGAPLGDLCFATCAPIAKRVTDECLSKIT